MEFEIVGFRKGNDGKDLTVRKKNVYMRILIRKKQVMNKYCPEQFEILGISGRGNNVNFKTKIYTKEDSDNYGDLNRGPTLVKNTKKRIYISEFLSRTSTLKKADV